MKEIEKQSIPNMVNLFIMVKSMLKSFSFLLKKHPSLFIINNSWNTLFFLFSSYSCVYYHNLLPHANMQIAQGL